MKNNLLFALLVSFLFTGCTGPVLTPTPTPTPTPSVLVLFNNKAGIPVDPHFYISGSNLTADELFADPANLYQNFNGETTIPANTLISANLPLTQAGTLGSNQADFADLTTFTAGEASEKPVLHSGTDYVAGQTVTFTFFVDANNKYHTTTTVQ